MKEKDVPDNSSVNIDLIRGHMDTIILRTLSDGDKYGYEILSEISDKSPAGCHPSGFQTGLSDSGDNS